MPMQTWQDCEPDYRLHEPASHCLVFGAMGKRACAMLYRTMSNLVMLYRVLGTAKFGFATSSRAHVANRIALMSNTLIDAFAKFGAKPKNRLRGRSAIADDGALVLSCSTLHFRHPRPGVLRYEDVLSRDSSDRPSAALLGEHLALARDGQLPVRMVVIAEAGAGKTRSNIYARPDVVGRLTEFDGDHFVVDFTRLIVDLKQPEGSRKRRG